MSRKRDKPLGTDNIENSEELDYSTFPSHVLLGENRLPRVVDKLVLDGDEAALLHELARELARRGLGGPFIDDAGAFDAEKAWKVLSNIRQLAHKE